MKRSFETELPSNIAEAFQYHEQPGVLERLIPPWESIELIGSSRSLKPGAEAVLALRVGPFSKRWVARHEEYDPPRLFSDRQVSGPFVEWHHRHRFIEIDDSTCRLRDEIEFALPGGSIGEFFGGSFIDAKLKSTFAYRHRRTIEDLKYQKQLVPFLANQARTVAVTGSRGLLGSEVCSLLRVLGCSVIHISRGRSIERDKGYFERHNEIAIEWDPSIGLKDPASLNGIDAFIHLAGKGIADERWNERVKDDLWRSRVDATAHLATQLSTLSRPPKAFVSASGVGIYGERSDEVCTEETRPAQDFLGKLASAWENASKPLSEAGNRVVAARLGIVLGGKGGSLRKMLGLFRLGLGGRLGNGTQYWSWIGIEDAACAMVHLALNDNCVGPYNLVAGSTTNSVFTSTLAKSVKRPAIAPVPTWALRLAMGELADTLLLTSTRAVAAKLEASGFRFRSQSLDSLFSHELGIEQAPLTN